MEGIENLNLYNARTKTQKNFLFRHWFSILIIVLSVCLSYRVNTTLLLFTFLLIAFKIITSKTSETIYWTFLLVSNVRMLDGAGVTFLVNILMALPFVVYFFRNGFSRRPTFAFIVAIGLFAMETLHSLIFGVSGEIINLIGWTLNILLCLIVTLDGKIKINRNDVFCAFATGIILSALMSFGAGLESPLKILSGISDGERLVGFGDDPNVYATYICLAIACLFNTRGKTLYRVCVLLVLCGLGFLTGSKMCILVMVGEIGLLAITLFFNKNRRHQKFIFVTFILLILIAVALNQYVVAFIDNFLKRLGGKGATLADITTGRSKILSDYIDILLKNPVCLLFGYGFSYNNLLGQVKNYEAHNTYMDLILSWGLIGTVIFIAILISFTKRYKKVRGIGKTSLLQNIPLIVILICFMSLSFLSASMFPLLLTIAVLMWLPDENKKRKSKEIIKENSNAEV